MEKVEKTKWSIAAASWAVTSPSPRIHKTYGWTSAPGRTHLWIASARVNCECNLTVMWVSLKCTKWNMNVRQVSWKWPARAVCRPESHFYQFIFSQITGNISQCVTFNFHNFWARNVEIAIIQKLVCWFCIILYIYTIFSIPFLMKNNGGFDLCSVGYRYPNHCRDEREGNLKLNDFGTQ